MSNVLGELNEEDKPRGFGLPRLGEEGKSRRKSMRPASGLKRLSEPRGISEEEGVRISKLKGQSSALKKISGGAY